MSTRRARAVRIIEAAAVPEATGDGERQKCRRRASGRSLATSCAKSKIELAIARIGEMSGEYALYKMAHGAHLACSGRPIGRAKARNNAHEMACRPARGRAYVCGVITREGLAVLKGSDSVNGAAASSGGER